MTIHISPLIRRTLTATCAALALLLIAGSLPADQKPATATAPAGETGDTGEAGAPPKTDEKPQAVSPDVDRILRQVEKAGDEVQQLAADFEYHYFKRLIRVQEWYSGKMVYAQPSNFLISFVDGEKQTFRFNGRVFVEDRPVQMQRNVYRLRGDDEPPVSSVGINQTPFPMPFGQKRDDVLKNFEVEYRGKAKLGPWKRPDVEQKEKPDETQYEHLVLTPHKDSPMAKEYARMDFWIDPATGLPKQIRTLDESKAILTVRFGTPTLNDKVEIEKSQFDEPRMPGGQWRRSYEDMTKDRPALPHQ